MIQNKGERWDTMRWQLVRLCDRYILILSHLPTANPSGEGIPHTRTQTDGCLGSIALLWQLGLGSVLRGPTRALPSISSPCHSSDPRHPHYQGIYTLRPWWLAPPAGAWVAFEAKSHKAKHWTFTALSLLSLPSSVRAESRWRTSCVQLDQRLPQRRISAIVK